MKATALYLFSRAMDAVPFAPQFLIFSRTGERLPESSLRYRIGHAWDVAVERLAMIFPEHWHDANH